MSLDFPSRAGERWFIDFVRDQSLQLVPGSKPVTRSILIFPRMFYQIRGNTDVQDTTRTVGHDVITGFFACRYIERVWGERSWLFAFVFLDWGGVEGGDSGFRG